MKKSKIIISLQALFIAAAIIFGTGISYNVTGQVGVLSAVADTHLSPDKDDSYKPGSAGYNRSQKRLDITHNILGIIYLIQTGGSLPDNVENISGGAEPVYRVSYTDESGQEMIRLIAAGIDVVRRQAGIAVGLIAPDLILSAQHKLFVSLPLSPADITTKASSTGMDFDNKTLYGLIAGLDNPITRLNALNYINNIRDDRLQDVAYALMLYLDDENESIRINTGIIIESIGEAILPYLEREKEHSPFLAGIIEDIRSRQDVYNYYRDIYQEPAITMAVVEAIFDIMPIQYIGFIRDDSGLFWGLLDNRSPLVRQAAILAVSQLGPDVPPHLMRFLIDRLEDRDSGVRVLAAVAIQKIGDIMLPALERRLTDTDPGSRLALIIGYVINNISNPLEGRTQPAGNVYAEMLPQLRSPDNNVRDNAAKRLSDQGMPKGVLAMIDSITRNADTMYQSDIDKLMQDINLLIADVSAQGPAVLSIDAEKSLSNLQNDLLAATQEMDKAYQDKLTFEMSEVIVDADAHRHSLDRLNSAYNAASNKVADLTDAVKRVERGLTRPNISQALTGFKPASSGLSGLVESLNEKAPDVLVFNPNVSMPEFIDKLLKSTPEEINTMQATLEDTLKTELGQLENRRLEILRSTMLDTEERARLVKETDASIAFIKESVNYERIGTRLAKGYRSALPALEPDTVKQRQFAFIIHEGDIPKEMVELLTQNSVYREALQQKHNCIIRLNTEGYDGIDTNNAVALSSVPITGVAKRLEIAGQYMYMPLDSLLILARAGLSNNEKAARLIYTILTGRDLSDDLWREIWISFTNSGLLRLDLPAPVAVDEQYYEILYRQALLALVAA
jgi:hypothetical protein